MALMNDSELGKIRWHCVRRGMLELDEILGNFFDQEFKDLSEPEQKLFVKLLEQPDPVLFDWLLGHLDPKNTDELALVKKIRKMSLKLQ